MPQEEQINSISIVVPAFRQESTIVKDIEGLEEVLSSLPYDYEIIIVVDGYSDKTKEKAEQNKSKKIKIVGYERNMGKGHAVRYGIMEAKGDVIGFIDAGMDISPIAIPQMIEIMKATDADIVIGSKIHKGSKVKYPVLRKVLSGGYRTLNQVLFGFDAKDVQVGLKLFRRKAAHDIFSKVTIKGFAFDIETLAIANSLGYKKIVEAPVEVNYKKGSISSANFWLVVARMLRDTGIVYYRLNVKHEYGKRK